MGVNNLHGSERRKKLFEEENLKVFKEES